MISAEKQTNAKYYFCYGIVKKVYIF